MIASATGCQAAVAVLETTKTPPEFPIVVLPDVTFIH
jgi:hypothetical protein